MNMRRILNGQSAIIHLIAGLLTPVWVYSWRLLEPDIRVFVFCAFFALLPDIDSQASLLGRLFPFLSRPLEQRFGHRQLTHSLFAVGSIGVLTWLIFGTTWWLLTAAYFSHLFIDMLVGFIGIPLLWPHQTRFYLIQIRPKSFSETILGLLLTLLILLPLHPEGRDLATDVLPQEDLVIQPTNTPTPSATPHVVVITIPNVYNIEQEILVNVGDLITQGDLIADLATYRQLTLPTATSTATATPTQTPTPTATATPVADRDSGRATPWPTINPFQLQAIQNNLELAQANYHRAIATGTPNPTYVAKLAEYPPQIQDRRNCIEREGVETDRGWLCQQELHQLEAEAAHYAALAQPSQPDPLAAQIARERYDAALIQYNQQIAALTPPPTETIAPATPTPTNTLMPTPTPTPVGTTAVLSTTPATQATIAPSPILAANDPTLVHALISGQVINIDIATIRTNAATIAIHILIATPIAPTPTPVEPSATPVAPTAVLQTQKPTSSLATPRPPTLPEPAHLTSATVLRTIDGDTILVQLKDGTEETVRLLGVDTPETVHPHRDVECFGREATYFTENKLPPGATIFLELDTQTGERDHYGRLLAHIWTQSSRLHNLDLLTLGYATHNNYGNPSRYSDTYAAAAALAQQNKTGLWSACSQETIP